MSISRTSRKNNSVIAVGDIHGDVNMLERILQMFIKNNSQIDKVIFIGDYVDSFTAKDIDIINCVTGVINFKKHYPDKVILLKGNHDLQYIYHPDYRCSGFRNSTLTQLRTLFSSNKNIFQDFYYHKPNKTLYSHAGVTETWIEKFPLVLPQETLELLENDLFDFLIDLEFSQLGRDYLYQAGEKRGGMRGDAGGIMWADAEELFEKPYFDGDVVHQVVGHTCMPSIRQYWYNDDENSITFIDNAQKLFYIH